MKWMQNYTRNLAYEISCHVYPSCERRSKSRNVRHYAVGNYEVFYEVNSQDAAVMIYRIFYGGRNIEAIIASEKNA